jgi:cellulose synthase/poly-beta-1,6-N-acetylglucosamine synthase-like glycosyltransferase
VGFRPATGHHLPCPSNPSSSRPIVPDLGRYLTDTTGSVRLLPRLPSACSLGKTYSSRISEWNMGDFGPRPINAQSQDLQFFFRFWNFLEGFGRFFMGFSGFLRLSVFYVLCFPFVFLCFFLSILNKF